MTSEMPDTLRKLRELARNLWWSWQPDIRALFRELDPTVWSAVYHNPVALLQRLPEEEIARRVQALEMQTRINQAHRQLQDYLQGSESWGTVHAGTLLARPVAYFSAEFGIHPSLPIYSGGLGVLAGDILKQASDSALPLVGIGLLYRRGYFQQRVDRAGLQHEYWIQLFPERIPAALVTDADGAPVELTFTVFGREVAFHVWRVDVGRVPLYLLDTEVERNDPIQRWITSRLYEGNSATRLGQYALLGSGGLRMLRALGIEPGVLHFNEGHPALAALELAAEHVAAGGSLADGLARASAHTVFTTHTPVPAGNETYPPEQFVDAFQDLPDRLGIDEAAFLDLCRTVPGTDEWPGMTPLALRVSRTANGVSRRHAEVAREMWRPLFGASSADEVPIRHVTNGVHLPAFVSGPMRALLDRHLGDGWLDRAADPATWEPVDAIPDEELWAARCEARARLVDYVRTKSVQDRLLRGEEPDYVQAAAQTFDADTLTLGFARRIATYKRLFLLTYDVERVRRLFSGDPPVQMVIAGKAHPLDDNAKRMLQQAFELRRANSLGARVAFLENYDLSVAAPVVAGCDVWINVPRPPLEASGTSGMKSAANGGLNLSVLDGWWWEAYDGENGWAIDGTGDEDEAAQDARHAAELYDLLEHEVLPLFHERDEHGLPRRWLAKVRASLRTNGPGYCAARMLDDYAETVYPAG
jgi:starch phosphorylase